MMNQFQSDRLAAQHRQQLELEAARARLAHEAADSATQSPHGVLDALGSRALAVRRLLATPVSRRLVRPGNAPVVS